MNRLLLFLLINFLFFQLGSSQPINSQVKDAIMPSPEAASLGKFEEIPVDYAHGLANVNFPIYQINHGPLSVSVGLRYHGSGINVRSVAAWCGEGFALEGQYMISRSVQGTHDDGLGGYYVTGNTLDISNVNHRREIATSARDGESDIYSYSIPGYSGKFFFDENQVPHFVPKTDLKIKVIYSNPFFEGFILIDPEGTKYYFGYIDDNNKGYVEITNPDVEEASFYRSGWYLARIESFDNIYKIDYNYHDNYTYSYDQISSCRIINYTSSGCRSADEINSCKDAASFVVDIEGKKLKSISSPLVTISFSSDGVRKDVTDGNTLDKISLKTGTFCKEYVLSYDYFEDNSSSGPQAYRLKLDQLQEQSCSGDTLPAFRFDYYGTLNNGVPYFINRFSRQIDSWGYFNGKTHNENTGTINIPSTTVPYLQSTLTRGASDRSTDFNYMVQGSLKAIHNPKGGSTHFEYEANSYPGTVTGSETTFFSLASCVDNMDGCCLEKQKDEDTTFINQTFINDATFDLFLSPSCTNPDENYFDILVKVYESVGTTFVYRTEIGFNQDATTPTTTPKQPLSSLYNFQPGVRYKFEIKTTDAFGRFQIYNAPQFTDNIAVGGLRIKKITYKDGLNAANDVSRSYFYYKEEGDTLSSGVLVKEPIYGYSMKAEHIEGETTEEVAMTIHSEESLVPLSSFQGSHISYARVEERRTGHGKTIHTYDITYSGIDKSYPAAPLYYQRNAGQLKTATIQKEDGRPINEVQITPEDKPYTYGPTFLKSITVKQFPPCEEQGGTIGFDGYYIASTEYNIRSSIYLVKSRSTTQDGVTNSNSSTYDPLERHFFPVTETMTNSDGTQFSTENSYVFDDSLIFGNHSYVYDSMVVRNQISSPIQVVQKANGITTKGTRIDFNSFHPTTGGPGPPNNFNAYPQEFSNYEMTWDESGQVKDDGWVTDALISFYDPLTGQPRQINKIGWETEHYTWHPVSGLNLSRRYEGFNWRKEYYPDTRLIKLEVDIDSQKVHYEYDPFIRLKKISSRNQQVVTEISYQFREGGKALNYINQKTSYAADPLGNSALREMQSRQYFGGQGRLLQEIQIAHSPNGKDIINAFAYNNQGQLSQSYEPFESVHNTGQYAADTAGIAFTLTEYEASPLNRERQITAPAWYPSQTKYGANSVADSVINYQTGGLYAAGKLYKNRIVDGNGNEKITFSDLRGKSILERVLSADGLQKRDLYRKYDLKEREIAIYPPNTTPTATELIYTKRYDVADNIVAKKIPDAAIMNFAYDARDLQIGMQNGNLQKDGKWMVTEYDDYGRVTMTGLNTNPSTVSDLWTKNYYDGNTASATLSELGITAADLPASLNADISIGKLTAQERFVLNGNTLTGDKVLRVMGYNDYGQMSRELGSNHYKGSRLWKHLEYDLADNLTRQLRWFHTTDLTLDQRDTIHITYDHQGRLIDTYHAMRNMPRQHISRLDYTIKDEIKARHLGAVQNGFLQAINYEYLDNGFLKGINPTMASDDLFKLDINYDQAITGLSGVGQRNGNITSLTWQVKGQPSQTYGYHYDYLDRLTAANYNLNNNAYGTSYSYDLRGNFTNISRRGVYSDGTNYVAQQIDSMAFTPHAGTNKIKTITDSAPCPNNKVIHRELDNTELHAVGQTIQADNTVMETAAITYQAGKSITLQAGFHAKAGTDFLAKIETCPQGGFETDGFVQRSHADIEYDVDGNRTKDPNKGIEIAFNYLNQPYKVTWQNGNTIEWLRDGGGTKLQRLTKRNGVAIGKLDYVDGSIEYEGDTLTTIYLEDAKATFDKGILEKYAWFLKNHLMSTQVVFEDDGSGKAAFISTHQQYPFGLEMEGDFGRNKSVKRLYNFKEQIGDFGLNWSDFGARYYLGNGGEPVFLGVDPISDKFPELSTYNYASNSPISNVDLHGLQSAGFMFALGNSRERIRQEQGKAAAKEFDRGVQTGAGATLGIASIFFPDPSDAIVLGALGRLGKTLGLFKTSNKIAQKLSKADDKVREVGEAIEEAMPGTIKDVEKVVKNSEGKIKTDFDLETDDFVIEVTKGGGKGKANQIKNKIQPETKKEVIIFGDKLKPSVKKELKKQNIRFFENKDDMINAIKNNRNK